MKAINIKTSAERLNILNAAGSDFSDEYLLQMAAAAYMIYGAQLIINKCARECDLFGLKDSFFQRKKFYIGEAAKAFESMKKNLEAGFDGWFEKVDKGKAELNEYVHQYGNDMAKFAILFVSRCEHTSEPRNEVFKFLRSLPADEESGDAEKVLEYFNRKFQ